MVLGRWYSTEDDFLSLGNCTNKRSGAPGEVIDICAAPKYGTRVCVVNKKTGRKQWLTVIDFRARWKQLFDREDPTKK